MSLRCRFGIHDWRFGDTYYHQVWGRGDTAFQRAVCVRCGRMTARYVGEASSQEKVQDHEQRHQR